MTAHDDAKGTCTIHWWGDAHDGAGWYYVDDEYPEEGSVGSFLHLGECVAHAINGGYTISGADDSQLVEGMRVVEVAANPAECVQRATELAKAWEEGWRARNNWNVSIKKSNPYSDPSQGERNVPGGACDTPGCTFHTPRCDRHVAQHERALRNGMPPSGRHG